MNLNKLFEKFARKNITVLRQGGEDALNLLYSRWLKTYDESLGSTPEEYLKKLSDEDLLEYLTEEAQSGTMGAAVIDELESRDCQKRLALFVKESDCDAAVMTAVEILERKGAKHNLSAYLDIVSDKTRDITLREELVEILKNNAGEAAEEIYSRIDDADIELKTVFAEILLCAPKDERTYSLLVDLFLNGNNIPLYCSYLGAYGDERAAAILYRALDNAIYADFIEISNAIERLGGTVDYEMKDFTDDPTFRLIKSGKK